METIGQVVPKITRSAGNLDFEGGFKPCRTGKKSFRASLGLVGIEVGYA